MTATEFDPLKAQREIVTGLADVAKVIHARALDAEKNFAEAEAEHNALQQMKGFMDGMLADARAKLRALEEAAAKDGSS